MEFIDCKNQISFEFNMDRVVDDWTLLMTLLGNDYMPNLPHFQLDNDALSVIYNAYKETLKTSNGSYIMRQKPKLMVKFVLNI